MMTLQQIAEWFGASFRGNGETRITGIETITAARPGDLTFAINATHLKKIETCKASAAIIPAHLADSIEGQSDEIALLICDNPEEAFSRIAKQFKPDLPRTRIGISPRAFVSDSADVHPSADVYPGAFIGDHVTIGANSTIFPCATLLDHCKIGADVTIFPNAVLYENTQVADKCVIHANAVLGAWGFGYKSDESGHRLSEQLGHVELGESVEIGACSTIDRATYGATRIGSGSKLDNQVMIGHNCQIGTHNLLCSQVGIAGSSSTGDFVIMGGQVGIADHVSIDEHAIVCAQSGVMHDLPGHQTYLGSPAMPAREKLQVFASEAKLPEMRRELRKLEKRIEKISAAMERLEKSGSSPENERRAA